MASAAGSVQAFSGGRMVIGLARGDSALAHLGMAPPPVSAFENYVRALQAYLRGEEVPFALADAAMGGRRADMATTESLNVGKRPTVSRMQWLPGDMPKVVVDVFGTGPRVIKIGALLGDRVTFAVGANPARIAWALEIARRARREAGLDPDGISYGAVVGMGIDDDAARGRARIAGVVATSSRFSFMHGQKIGPMDEQEESIFRRVQESYDMTRHSVHTSTQASVMPDWFIDRHAITGGPDNVIARLQQIHALGIDRVACLFHGSHSGIEDQIDAAYAQFARHVIPAFK